MALALYGGCGLLLIWFNAALPWWVIMPVGAYLIAWHFSLQHEAIHSFRGVPAWLRFAVVFPPLGLWFPYPLYRKSHSTHHRDVHLTIPGVDTESYYVLQADWAAHGTLCRAALLMFNQTMAGRLLVGPLLRLWILVDQGNAPRAARGLQPFAALGRACRRGRQFSSGSSPASAAFPGGSTACWSPIPGLSLGLLRAFTEHRAAEDSQERTASVESNALFSMLYLYNNLHVAHHLKPTMPWYEIPRFYRENRAALLASNGEFVYPGYAVLARRYLLAPVFSPVHPTL